MNPLRRVFCCPISKRSNHDSQYAADNEDVNDEISKR